MEKEIREIEQQLIQHMEALTNIAIQEVEIHESLEDLRTQKKSLTKNVKKLSEKLNQVRQQVPQLETVGSEN